MENFQQRNIEIIANIKEKADVDRIQVEVFYTKRNRSEKTFSTFNAQNRSRWRTAHFTVHLVIIQ